MQERYDHGQQETSSLNSPDIDEHQPWLTLMIGLKHSGTIRERGQLTGELDERLCGYFLLEYQL